MIMKIKEIFTALMLLVGVCAFAQDAGKRTFVEASELTLVGKLFPDTPVPYHRVDTVIHKGFTPYENQQVRMSSGISVSFRTNSGSISVKADYGQTRSTRSSTYLTARGFDLYIKVDGKWQWAGVNSPKNDNSLSKNIYLVKDMSEGWKECLLYLPNFSEILSLKIGVDAGASIEKCDIPFKGRVGMFGSSFTHGSSTSRPGMTWPAQLSRMTGYQFLSLGCGGNSKLQPYFAEALADADVDVFVFDAFSNPKPELIEERLFDFIDIIRKKHPDTPLIFLKSIYRSRARFNVQLDEADKVKAEMAEKMIREAQKRYDNIYWIDTTNPLSDKLETSVDGTHPSDYGYYLMAESVCRPLTKILKKYIK